MAYRNKKPVKVDNDTLVIREQILKGIPKIGHLVLLTEDDPEVDTPSRFKEALFDFQKKTVKRILDIEEKRYTQILLSSAYSEINTSTPLVATTSACKLCEVFGAGKTITVLAVIASRPKPSAVIENCNSALGCTSIPKLTYNNRQHSVTDGNYDLFTGFQNEITKKYSGVILPSMIVVGTQVLEQWRLAIKRFTDFTVFTIANAFSLGQFYDMYKNGSIDSFDIILIKNGTVTGNFVLDDENENDKTSIRSILSVIGKILKGKACQWLVYDDFDTIRIPAETVSLNGLFTIYVSASNNDADLVDTDKNNTGRDRTNKKYDSIEEMLAVNISPPILSATQDKILVSNFGIRCKQDFIEKSTNLPKFSVYKCVYLNQNDKYMQLLGAMGTNNATAIMEGLNADALHTVADNLGIKTDPSPFAIFKKLLDTEFEKYEHDCLVIQSSIGTSQIYNKVLDDDKAVIDEDDKRLPIHSRELYSDTEIESIRSGIIGIAKKWKNSVDERIVKVNDIGFIKYSARNVPRVFEDVKVEFTEYKKIDGKIIDNVKSNLKQGECQVCCLPLEDIVIAKCCNITVCGMCLKDGFHLSVHKTMTKDADGKSKEVSLIKGKCPNCPKHIDMKNDLIYVTQGISIDDILEKTGVEEVFVEKTAEVEVEATESTEKDPAETDNLKLRALYDIIMGKKPKDVANSTYVMKNLIKGKADLPLPEDTARKVLVFAGFNETLKMTAEYLDKTNIKYITLSGTFKELSVSLEKFRKATTTTVLLVNSNENCAGMNIKFCTDIVFMHKIHNEHIEAQVSGRAQRVGRKFNLNIFFLLYKNEDIYMGDTSEVIRPY